MPFLLLGLAGVLSVVTLLDKIDDLQDKSSKTAINVGGLILVGAGAWLLYKQMK